MKLSLRFRSGVYTLCHLALLLTFVGSIVGCGGLLPRGRAATPSPFEDFEGARAALDKVVPFQTTLAQLKDLGFDAEGGTNVVVIPFPDILGRLVPHPAIPMDAMDAGIRRCLAVQMGCRGYSFHFENQSRRREGGFWADFLNIHRTTVVRGWRFDALVVVGDGVVLFRNHAGQAHIDQVEVQVNPLGPLQPAGESAGQLIRRH